MLRVNRFVLIAAAMCVACAPSLSTDDEQDVDAGPDRVDAGDPDAGEPDAGDDAPDAGPVDAGPCGGLDISGRCEGDRAVWCEGDRLRSRDCSNFGGADLSCTVVQGWGSWCASRVGQKCAFTSNGTTRYSICGDASGPAADQGCEFQDGCVTGATQCTPAAQGQPFVRFCQGTRLAYDCTE